MKNEIEYINGRMDQEEKNLWDSSKELGNDAIWEE